MSYIWEPEDRYEYDECHEWYSDKAELQDTVVVGTSREESTDRAREWDDLTEYPSTEVVVIVIASKKYTKCREHTDDHMIRSGFVI